MILTVTPNPALDLTYHVEALNVGGSHRVEPARVRAGGKGVNVARVAHQTGNSVIALTPVGSDNTGREFEAELVSSGLPHRLLPVSAATRRSIAIVDTSTGETTIFNEHGAPLTPAECGAILASAAALGDQARCLVGSGSLPALAPGDFYARLVELARERSLPSVIDATGRELLLAASAGATVLKPNRRELAEATGENDPVVGARMLLQLGAGLVLVSLGAVGMLAVTIAHSLRARLAEPLIGNATGAGDAALAAAASCLAAGEADPAVILRRATAWSAAAVLVPQAGEIAGGYAELEKQVILDRL